MDFSTAITIVKECLESVGTTINVDDYDGLIVKELKASNTLDDGRNTNQTHIAITGEQMEIFPYLRSEGYFNNGSDSDLKKYFVAQIPVTLSESNANYLNKTCEPMPIRFVNGKFKS